MRRPFAGWTRLFISKTGVPLFCCGSFAGISCRGADSGGNLKFTQPGEHYVEMTFDSKKVKFTGGTSNYIQFFIK